MYKKKTISCASINNTHFFAIRLPRKIFFLGPFFGLVFFTCSLCYAIDSEFPASPLNPKILEQLKHTTPNNEDEFILKEVEGLPSQTLYAGISDFLLQARVRHSDTMPSLDIAVHYPQGFDFSEVDQAIEEWAKKLFTETRSLEFDDEAIDGKKAHYSFYTTYALAYPSSKAVSLVFNSWQYTGGAHNMWEDRIVNIDLTTGKPLTLEQIFQGPQSLSAVSSWLSSRPIESRGSALGQTSGEETMRISVQPADLTIDRFVLLPEGLRIVFNPYEKASFSMGTVTLSIPRSEFKNLGISDTFWQ